MASLPGAVEGTGPGHGDETVRVPLEGVATVGTGPVARQGTTEENVIVLWIGGVRGLTVLAGLN